MKISALLKHLAITLLVLIGVSLGLTHAVKAAPGDIPEVTNATFDLFNPLKTFGNAGSETLYTPAGIINRVLVFAFPLAGLILFVMLVWAGFEMLSGAATKKSMDSGRQRATAAVVGFLLLFSSYWVIKIVQSIFGAQVI